MNASSYHYMVYAPLRNGMFIRQLFTTLGDATRFAQFLRDTHSLKVVNVYPYLLCLPDEEEQECDNGFFPVYY